MRFRIYQFDEKICAVLGPHARRWRSGGRLVTIPDRFQNADLFRRFFHEIAVTSGMLRLELSMDLGFPVNPARFWQLAAVQRCQSLQVVRLPDRRGWKLTSQRIINWLSFPGPEKRLLLAEYAINRSVSRVIDEIIRVRLVGVSSA